MTVCYGGKQLLAITGTACTAGKTRSYDCLLRREAIVSNYRYGMYSGKNEKL